MLLMTPILLLLLSFNSRSGLAAPTEFDEIKSNLSAVWEEIDYLKQELADHHHEGHSEKDHDTLVMDVGVMKHEHHVHHHHGEDDAQEMHPLHHLHHSHDALQHLDSEHGHDISAGNVVKDEHDVHDLHGSSDSQDQDGDDHDHDQRHRRHNQEHETDEHEHHTHEHGHSSDEHEHEHHVHEHGHGSDHEHEHHVHEHGHSSDEHEHHVHEHEHSSDEHEHHVHEHVHGSDEHENEHGSDEDEHEHHMHEHEHGSDHEHEHHVHEHEHGSDHEHEHHVHGHGHGSDHEHEHHVHGHGSDHEHGHGSDHVHHAHVDHDDYMDLQDIASSEIHNDDVEPFNSTDHEHHDRHHHMHLQRDDPHHPENQPAGTLLSATCSMAPTNQTSPVSHIKGNVTLYQRADFKGPVYFDLELEGFEGENQYAFHVHSKRVENGDCSTTGSHFNPHGVTHGDPTTGISHVGDLGNLMVGEEGSLSDYLIVDHKVSFSGDAKIIMKSLVIHAGRDDLGLGGHPSSLSSGNAGPRMACCNIFVRPDFRFRFGG